MATRKSPMSKQTAHDRVSTITHLADTIKYNSKHALAHGKETLKQAKKLRDPASATLQHNASHAMRHAAEVAEHADKLLQHLRKYPGGKATLDELNASPPSRTPPPPSKKGKNG